MRAMRMRWLQLWRNRRPWAAIGEVAGAAAAARVLVINDRGLSPGELVAVDALTAPRTLPGGHYWFDPQTGDLGWVGSPTVYLNLFLGESPDNPREVVDIARLQLCRTAGLLDSTARSVTNPI